MAKMCHSCAVAQTRVYASLPIAFHSIATTCMQENAEDDEQTGLDFADITILITAFTASIVCECRVGATADVAILLVVDMACAMLFCQT